MLANLAQSANISDVPFSGVFFDIFTELSIDGGASWAQGVGPVPEPSAPALVAAGLAGLFAIRRR